MPQHRRNAIVAGTLATTVLVNTESRATYSVLVHDSTTREFGAAAISCVGDFDLSLIFGLVPGSATRTTSFAFFAQALYSEENHAEILRLGASGEHPDFILSTLTNPVYDDRAAERQYHLLTSTGAPLTWTGSETLAYAGTRSGSGDQWSFTAAGNILTSERVLQRLEASLRETSGPLESRLLKALAAGAAEGEGDSRCGELPGDSAFLTVRTESGVARLAHSVIDTAPQNPLSELERWLEQQPSPSQSSQPAPTTESPLDGPPVTDMPPGPVSEGTGRCQLSTRTSSAPWSWARWFASASTLALGLHLRRRPSMLRSKPQRDFLGNPAERQRRTRR